MRTRRVFLGGASAAAQVPAPLVVPVHLVVDSRSEIPRGYWRGFSDSIWPQVINDFHRGGISIRDFMTKGQVKRLPSGLPEFTGLTRGVINFVLTGQLPVTWDRGRGMTGVALRHEGYHLCVADMNRAHGHQFPFVSVNTFIHELLHVLLGDIQEARPKGAEGGMREARIDFYATRLWLFGDGAYIREQTAKYLAGGNPP